MPSKKSLNTAGPVTLAILALPECSSSVLYSLYDVLSSVGQLWSVLTGEGEGVEGFAVQIVAPQSEMFLCHGGIPVNPHCDLHHCQNAAVVIVPDLFLLPDFQPDSHWQQARQWLRQRYEAGALICSVCTGSILLADTGLLNGKEATSHWSAAQMFQQRWPEVRLNIEKIFVIADPEQRLITTGGAASWIELTLYLIKHFFGYQEALRIAKIYLLGDRSDGQLPFAALPLAQQHQDAVVGECQLWLADHYAEPSPVQKMMDFGGLPERTFKRRFVSATGQKPVEYVQNLRIEEAKQLLETTSEQVEEIGVQVGYEDPAYFRKLFRKKVGVTPSHYRKKFQAIRYLGMS